MRLERENLNSASCMYVPEVPMKRGSPSEPSALVEMPWGMHVWIWSWERAPDGRCRDRSVRRCN